MLRTSFNTGWRTRPKVSSFLELTGGPREWQEVTLPHDALIGLERSPQNVPGALTGFYPGGAFEYVKRFTAPDGYQEGRVEVEFDGVYRHSAVYVNGDFAGGRPSGYVPFRLRIDPFLHDGENEIRVECRTHLDSRWYAGAGIYRDVSLLVGGPLHLAAGGVRISTPDIDDERAVVDVAATVQSDSGRLSQVRLAFEVVAPDGSVAAVAEVPVSARPTSQTVVRQRLTVPAPVRWRLEDAALYTCRVRLTRDGEAVDSVDTSFGIRTLQWDALHGLRLNGETVKLRGGCLHHDNGVLGAATFARAEERRVELLKAAGYNAIRSAHNPISSAMLDACDQLGMLVMDEAFDTWTSPKVDFDHSLDLPTWWREDLRSMVLRDVNHPSVVLYSIGNEIPEIGSPWGAALGRDMVELVKGLDDTRPVTNGINPFFAFQADIRSMKDAPPGASDEVGINTLMTQLAEAGPAAVAAEAVTSRIEESMAQLDVAGYNYADGRYELDLERYPQRLILGTEADTTRIETIWDLVTRHERVLGDFSWTAWDYIGEAGIGRVSTGEDDKGFVGAFPWRLSWAGDLDITGRRRSLSHYRETVWGLRSEPHIAVHRPGSSGTAATPWAWTDSLDSWSWPGHEGQLIRIDVYSDADEVELSCNGETVGRVKVGEQRRYLATFQIPYAPGDLEAVAFRKGGEVGRSALRSAGDELELRVTTDRSVIRVDDHDLAFVEICLSDDDGTVHVLRDREVTVTVTGAGILQGLGSADPQSTYDYTGTTTSTFAGRALAVVRPTGVGVITVMVEADDCEPCTVTVTSEQGAEHGDGR
jgi:hypothetical protein